MKTKQETRKEILAYRNAMTLDEVTARSRQIIQQVLKTPEYEEADNILLYADYCHEVMTRELFEDAILRKKRVYFPKTYGEEYRMEFYQVVSVKQLEAGYKGIREPKEDAKARYVFCSREDTLMLLPGVAFGTDGYRIGYGKGFYDRYLADKGQITRMALAFAGQITEPFCHEAYDMKMDKIVTEELIYSFLRV